MQLSSSSQARRGSFSPLRLTPKKQRNTSSTTSPLCLPPMPSNVAAARASVAKTPSPQRHNNNRVVLGSKQKKLVRFRHGNPTKGVDYDSDCPEWTFDEPPEGTGPSLSLKPLATSPLSVSSPRVPSSSSSSKREKQRIRSSSTTPVKSSLKHRLVARPRVQRGSSSAITIDDAGVEESEEEEDHAAVEGGGRKMNPNLANARHPLPVPLG